jgi:transposase
MIHATCWAHARRKFYEAAKLHPADAVATRIVQSINELFARDARARVQNLDHTARRRLRQQEATPLLESLRSQIKAALHGALRASAMDRRFVDAEASCRFRSGQHTAAAKSIVSRGKRVSMDEIG